MYEAIRQYEEELVLQCDDCPSFLSEYADLLCFGCPCRHWEAIVRDVDVVAFDENIHSMG